ncbi:MAG: hypothetical protein HYX41_04705 [Bdellovibrio sp.]|nr:hypothetical protein [Bdellovibrio sp.]
MKKLFLVLALFVSTSANAAYFYENPSNQGIRNVFDTRVQQEAHLYTEKEYNQKQADSSGIPDLKATWIPNTVWDLFMYRSHIRSRLIKQREWHDYVDLGIHLKKSAEFLEWIGQRGFNEQLAQKIYSEIIERLLSEIAAIELDTFPIIPRWKADDLECLFAYSQDPRLAEIRSSVSGLGRFRCSS